MFCKRVRTPSTVARTRRRTATARCVAHPRSAVRDMVGRSRGAVQVHERGARPTYFLDKRISLLLLGVWLRISRASTRATPRASTSLSAAWTLLKLSGRQSMYTPTRDLGATNNPGMRPGERRSSPHAPASIIAGGCILADPWRDRRLTAANAWLRRPDSGAELCRRPAAGRSNRIAKCRTEDSFHARLGSTSQSRASPARPWRAVGCWLNHSPQPALGEAKAIVTALPGSTPMRRRVRFASIRYRYTVSSASSKPS